jgi:hypothetical protein
MKDCKVFTVTPEILDLFRNEKVQARTVKKLIPNYLDYRLQKPQLIDSKYLEEPAIKLYDYLTGSYWVTAQEFLDGIQSILEYEGLLRKDDSQEIFHFDGSYLDEGYGYYQISETAEKLYIESEAYLLERICKEIREAKKKEKLGSKNMEITTNMLNEIANNPILMQQLLAMKEY